MKSREQNFTFDKQDREKAMEWLNGGQSSPMQDGEMNATPNRKIRIHNETASNNNIKREFQQIREPMEPRNKKVSFNARELIYDPTKLTPHIRQIEPENHESSHNANISSSFITDDFTSHSDFKPAPKLTPNMNLIENDKDKKEKNERSLDDLIQSRKYETPQQVKRDLDAPSSKPISSH